MASHTKTVNIEHPKTGEQYAVTEYAYSNTKVNGSETYADQGFKITSWGDGQEYTPPPTAPAEKPAPAKADTKAESK